MIYRSIAMLLAVLIPLVCPHPALSEEPTTAIKGPIDAVVVILNDSRYKAPGTQSAQRDVIWKTVKPMFDFNEISRRAVARNWGRFTDTEKAAFTDVFAQFLGNTYIDKLQGEYHNEQIIYLGQQLHKEVYAEVKTHVVRETIKIPVNYRLRKNTDGQWKVYDIIVERVSLVKNYRTQFTSILRKEQPAQLIRRLNEKLTQQNNRLENNG